MSPRIWSLCAVVCIAGCGTGMDAIADAGASADVGTAGDAGPLTPLEAWELAWAERDAERRLALLEIATDDSVRYVSPEVGDIRGRDALSSVIRGFHTDVPGGRTSVTSGYDEHDARVRYAWDVRDGAGALIATGRDVVALAPDGRFARVVEFWGEPPPAGALTAVQQAYLDAWNTDDATARAALLSTAVTDDVVTLRPPAVRASGREALSTLIGETLADQPGRVETLTSGFIVNAELWYVEWETRDAGGALLAEGVLSAVLAPDGRIAETVAFEGDLPPR